MKNVNQLVIEGNCTKDPDLKYTPNGTAVLSFSIASNSDYKKGDEWIKSVLFLDISVWGNMPKCLTTGSPKV